jgi:hypothetical protein
MAENQQEADIINRERANMQARMTEHFAGLGVAVRVKHFQGDSSYPTEYTIAYGHIVVVGPTFELALQDFIERLIAELPLLPAPKKRAK